MMQWYIVERSVDLTTQDIAIIHYIFPLRDVKTENLNTKTAEVK